MLICKRIIRDGKVPPMSYIRLMKESVRILNEIEKYLKSIKQSEKMRKL